MNELVTSLRELVKYLWTSYRCWRGYHPHDKLTPVPAAFGYGLVHCQKCDRTAEATKDLLTRGWLYQRDGFK